MSNNGYLYHAGAYIDEECGVRWSRHTRRTKRAAEKEAFKMAGDSYIAVIEYWDAIWGYRPGTADAVICCYIVQKL